MTHRPMHAQHLLLFLQRQPHFLRFLSGTGTGVVGLVGMGVPAGAQRSDVFAMDSDGVGCASERSGVLRSGPAIVSSHGVGLESAPLSPVLFPFSNVAVVGIFACLAGSGSDSGFSPSAHTSPECAVHHPMEVPNRRIPAWGTHPRMRGVSLRRGYRVG